MISENTSRSILIFAISLIAPFLVWVLLRIVGSYNPPSFDPNPWIQDMVKNPTAILSDSSAVRWAAITSKNGELFWQKNPQTEKPLTDFEDTQGKVIFVIQAQGPSLAKKFYDFLKDKNLMSRSLIVSSSDGFLKDLRFYDGNLALGCGQAYIVRWRALKQLGLHNLMTITMSGAWLEPQIFSSSLAELTKNFTALNVPVFIGPVTTEQAKNLPSGANILILPTE